MSVKRRDGILRSMMIVLMLAVVFTASGLSVLAMGSPEIQSFHMPGMVNLSADENNTTGNDTGNSTANSTAANGTAGNDTGNSTANATTSNGAGGAGTTNGKSGVVLAIYKPFAALGLFFFIVGMVLTVYGHARRRHHDAEGLGLLMIFLGIVIVLGSIVLPYLHWL